MDDTTYGSGIIGRTRMTPIETSATLVILQPTIHQVFAISYVKSIRSNVSTPSAA